MQEARFARAGAAVSFRQKNVKNYTYLGKKIYVAVLADNANINTEG